MLGRAMAGKHAASKGSSAAGATSRLVGPPRISRQNRRKLKHGLVAGVLALSMIAVFAPEVLEDARALLPGAASVPGVRGPRAHRGATGNLDAAAPRRRRQSSPTLRGWNDSTVAAKIVSLPLELPERFLNRPEFAAKDSTYKHWGFDLRVSNKLPIDRTLPDHRSEGCRAVQYPDVREMPTVSVIIIHYNEPLSTLLRNVISVINNSPPALLGEVVLVDDNSTLDELSELPRHVDAINKQTKPGLVRTFRRNEHTGIVGARIRGAKEAKHDIIVFLDSHCETLPGWLEPLVARIHEDRTRVVIPNIRGFHLDTIEVFDNAPWPPSKGIMSWRVNFVPVTADLERDLVDPAHPFESPVYSPVMPGGLFAMDRRWFWELGAYDPELLYYGAEHVELSVRAWMCGGSMESVPCSNVGHIYREFNRFDNAFDPLIKQVHIGRVLNRNDARVAKVWLDEYNDIFTRARLLQGIDLGPNIDKRVALRSKLQCKPFKYFLDSVLGPSFYVPDLTPTVVTLRPKSAPTACLRSGSASEASVPALRPCVEGAAIDPHGMVSGTGDSGELWTLTSSGHVQSALMRDAKNFVCLRVTSLEMTGCAEAVRWDFEPRPAGAQLRLRGTDQCMARRSSPADPSAGTIERCSNSTRQLWRWEDVAGGGGAGVILGAELAALRAAHGGDGKFGSAPAGDTAGMCLDCMQRTRGGVGYYGCHRGGTQRWRVSIDGKIQVASGEDACLGVRHRLGQYRCAKGDREQVWRRDGDTLRPASDEKMCLTADAAGSNGGKPTLDLCADSNANQLWEARAEKVDFDLGVKFPSRFN